MTLTEIAHLLGKLYNEQAERRFIEWQNSEDLKARKLYLTPEEGWPGKNAEERNNAAERTFANDDPCRQMTGAIGENKIKLGQIEGEIMAWEAERRALEWEIRERLIDALSWKRVEAQVIADQVFDDAALNAAVEQTIDYLNQLEEVVDQSDDDLPF